jgi:hypothetical protein
MKINLTPQKFEELFKKSYSLDHIYFLKLIKEQCDISDMLKNSVKISVLHQSLIRKGLITENGEKLTTIGENLLNYVETEEEIKFVKKKLSISDFDAWWKTFPGTDTFTYKGKKFTGSRSIRVNKEECKIKFNKILIEGEYTAKQLTEALAYDVNQKKEASFIQNNNKLTYMQNSLTYLNQRSFEPFIELINQGVEIENTPQSSTDI